MTVQEALLPVARVVKLLGILWNIACVGFALFTVASSQRFSDAVSDAWPVVLVGGFGFVVAWAIAALIERFREKMT